MSVDAGAGTNGFQIESADESALPFIAFSLALAGRSIMDLNQDLASMHAKRSMGNPGLAALFNPAMLPSDWRGLSGLDILAITADEWTALPPGVKTAALQWVRLGGALHIYRKPDSPGLEALGIRRDGPRNGAVEADSFLGLGSVTARHWDGKELDAAVAGQFQREHPNRRRESADALRLDDAGKKPDRTDSTLRPDNTVNSVPLVAALGEKSFAAWQVGLILFVFGIVVGPVNLFYFARAGRRHKLFVTTPLISLGAAGLLLLVIFFQDGTGGKGHRAALVYLDAADNAAFVRQFQVSRTGVLFGGSFTTADPAVVTMAVLPPSRWTRFKPDDDYGYRDRGDSQRYSVSDHNFAGDWFQSRAEQAQIIDAVQSTRGRLELKPGTGAPVIVSSLTSPLERVFYVDGNGKYWASPGKVTTGAEVSLTESSRGSFLEWISDAAARIPRAARRNLQAHEPVNFFFASSSDPRAGMVDTLDSIDWESDSVLLFGPLPAK
jgi:hypothetical protein